MKSSPWPRLFTTCLAVVAVGFVIDTARAQFSMCQPQVAGCVNSPCTQFNGNCVGGQAYTRTIVQSLNYNPCNAGPVPNCPNVLDDVCKEFFYTESLMGPCGDPPICSVTATRRGC